MKNGRINWGVVLDSQANNVSRNQLIIRIIRKFPDRNFLVLVKRVSQGEYLVNELKKIGENVTSLIGDNQEFDVNSRILVGTCQKVGVGFDHSKMDTLLLGADLEEYFVQYLGRVFRTQEGTPIIFDLVDNNSLLTKHFATRRKIYQDHGGIVKNLNKDTLNESDD
jgi:superfamily II DNA or RNA helicase